MADNKKYYYLKLKDNFYESDEMIILQTMQDGYIYSDILMKLYLRSLKTEGRLMYRDYIPYTPEVLAPIVRHQVGTVEKALETFKKLGLIEVLDNGAIYMMDIQNFIGESSTEADRIRIFRNKIKQEKTKKIPPCTNVQQMYDKSTPEIEIDIELDKDINIEPQKKKKLTDKDYDDNFEKLWELLKPNKNDRKSKVIKKRKKELYLMGFERVKKAIELYLKMQDEKYYHKRDNFLNDIIDNYLDKSESDFDVGEVTSSKASYDIDEYENDWKNHQASMLQAFMNKGVAVPNAV